MIRKLLLCTPEFYDIEYSINPWMDVNNRVDKNLAWKQWKNLISVLENLGVEIKTIEGQPNLPDMTFAGDCGVMIKGQFLASNFLHPERQPEREHYVNWMKENNYNVIDVPKDLIFEGLGDILYYEDNLVFGYGPRTSKNVRKVLEEVFPKNKILLEIPIKDKAYFHLAMAAGLINESTLLYYPPAFSDETVDLIKKTFENAIPVGKKDGTEDFVCNNIPIGNKILFHDCSLLLEEQLNKLGFAVIRVDVSEFKKSGASLRCLVLNMHD